MSNMIVSGNKKHGRINNLLTLLFSLLFLFHSLVFMFII